MCPPNVTTVIASNRDKLQILKKDITLSRIRQNNCFFIACQWSHAHVPRKWE